MLNRKPGEDGKQATERARGMPWWNEVVDETVWWTASHWMFVAKGTA